VSFSATSLAVPQAIQNVLGFSPENPDLKIFLSNPAKTANSSHIAHRLKLVKRLFIRFLSSRLRQTA
jgi:hypothetical protein